MEQLSAPCLDCGKRVLGCHSKCEEYKTYKGVKATDNQKKSNYNVQRNIVTSFEIDAKLKRSKTKRKKVRYSKER